MKNGKTFEVLSDGLVRLRGEQPDAKNANASARKKPGKKTESIAQKAVRTLVTAMEKRMYPKGVSHPSAHIARKTSGSSEQTSTTSSKPQKSTESRCSVRTVAGTKLSKSTEFRLWSRLLLRVQKARMKELKRIEAELLEESKWYETWAKEGKL